MQHMTVVFPKSEKRTQWEKTFNEVKQKINAALDYQPIPEFIGKRLMRFSMSKHFTPCIKFNEMIFRRQSVDS